MALTTFVQLAISIAAAQSPTIQSFNTGLVACFHSHFPDRVRVYSTATVLQNMESDGFSPNEAGYKAVSKYAAAPNAPSLIAVGRRALPPQQTLHLTCVDGTVGDAYDLTLVGSDGKSHAIHYENVVDEGPVVAGTALSGTATVTNGSAAVTFSAAQTLAAGTIITFSSQPNAAYVIAAATTSSTSATLTGIYTGPSSSSATATPALTTAVTNGSANVTFGANVTLLKGALLSFDSQPGVQYVLSANVTASTSGTLTQAYSGPTASAAQTQALAPLSGTFGATNGSPLVPTTASQVSAVAVGDSLQFDAQPGVYYPVTAVSASQITLARGYSGTTAAAATAAKVCASSTAATFLQATMASLTGIGTPTVSGSVVTLARTDGQLTDVQSWMSNGFQSIQLADVTADPGLASDLDAIRAANNLAWYGFALDSSSQAEIEAAASWAESTGVGGKFFFGATSDYANLEQSITSDVFSVLKSLSYERSFVVQDDSALLSYAGPAVMGQVLAVVPKRFPFAYMTLPAVPADSDTTLTDGQALVLNTMSASQPGTGGKNGNYYKSQGGLNWLWPGVTPSGQFADLTIFADWLYANLQADVAVALAKKPPFTDPGIHSVLNAIDARLRFASGPNVGQIVPDGQDPARPISVIGPTAASVSPTDRGDRNLSGVTWSAGLPGAILTAVISGVLNP